MNTRFFIFIQAIRQQARRNETHLGLKKKEVLSLFVTKASKLHRSVDPPLKTVHRRRHSCVSTSEGSDKQLVCRAVEWIALASIESKMTGVHLEGWKGECTLHEPIDPEIACY